MALFTRVLELGIDGEASVFIWRGSTRVNQVPYHMWFCSNPLLSRPQSSFSEGGMVLFRLLSMLLPPLTTDLFLHRYVSLLVFATL